MNNAGRCLLLRPSPLLPLDLSQMCLLQFFRNSAELFQEHCAGRNIRKPMVEYTAEDFQALLSTNLESAFGLTQVAL